jgi:hypothetical protein
VIQIAGGIILAIVLLWLGRGLLEAMFSGFKVSPGCGCAAMVIFGILLFGLAMCVFA